MKIRFDAGQPYQLEAIQAVVDLFEGQPASADAFDLPGGDDQMPGFVMPGFGNRLLVGEEALLANLNTVQRRNGINASENLAGPHFSVEMETGTGKTYIYLRTIFELHRTYGFSKFVIVVPSVAIREGVLASLRLMREHFAALYGNTPLDAWVYDAKQVSRLRQFAGSSQLQVLVINIDAFNKQANNVIHQESDRMSGYRPIAFIRQACPIAILDEPQNMESENAQQAIASLNPLCTLRYSATHRNAYNLVYRLDPVRAYDLGLVKRIEVDSVLEEPDFNRPFLSLKKITAGARTLTAKVELDIDTPQGVKRKIVTVKPDSDLQVLAAGREHYTGYRVSEIRNDAVIFANGLRLQVGETRENARDDIMRAQIRNTIRAHFEKELKVLALPPDQRMKILSLFFIDRVAHYHEPDGKIRRWFRDEYTRLAASPEFAALNPPPVEVVHNGYFAVSKDRTPKDTSGGTQADDDAYELIMRNKERLLQLEEPLRFLFSHSALREGWDNPNVFQICTLADSVSEIRKRQEIGRGLRLPVMASGERCFDTSINKLTVVANESYEDFARKLQAEIQEDTGHIFGKDRLANKRSRKRVRLRKHWQTEEFLALWEKIRPRTRYRVKFDTTELIKRAAMAVRYMKEVRAAKLVNRRAALDITDDGIDTRIVLASDVSLDYRTTRIPDLVGWLQRETELTRGTLAAILRDSGRLGDVAINPQQFLDQAVVAIRDTMQLLMVEGIEYELVGDWYELDIFRDGETDSYENRVVPVEHSVYDGVEFDSEVERQFAVNLDHNPDIRLFVKLPRGFKVNTPLGTYNPDWAIVKHHDRTIYMVRETKSALGVLNLRPGEAARIACGKAHFGTLGVDFKPVTSANDV